MEAITFTIPGPPQGKARARTIHTIAGTRSFTPERTVLYENLIKTSYQETKQEPFAAGIPLKVTITASFLPPASISKKQRSRMLLGELLPTKKPDIDNIAKVVLDALNGIAYQDDTQVICLILEKRYAAVPGVSVTILPVTGEQVV